MKGGTLTVMDFILHASHEERVITYAIWGALLLVYIILGLYQKIKNRK